MPLTAANAREGWLPRTLLALLQRGLVAAAPAGETVEAVVLLADVSGFTALTERLAESGADGAEKLSEIFNARFSGLIDTLGRHGGDITHFAGDAIVAIWPLASAGSRAGAVRRAAACGLALQALPAAAADGAHALPLRVGVCVGSAWWALLGATDEQAFVFGGMPVVAAGVAAAAGQPGEVVVSAEAWPLLQPGRPHEPGGAAVASGRRRLPVCRGDAARGARAGGLRSAVGPPRQRHVAQSSRHDHAHRPRGELQL